MICYNIVSWTFSLLCALKLALIFLFSLFLVSEATNDSTMDDVVENHVADQLLSDTTPNAMEAEFSGSSPANLLERPTNHTEALGHDHLGTNDLTVGGFLENHEEPRDKEQCPEENIPASSLNKGKKLMHCRSHEEVNTELKAQIMKEIRKPGRSMYNERQTADSIFVYALRKKSN